MNGVADLIFIANQYSPLVTPGLIKIEYRCTCSLEAAVNFTFRRGNTFNAAEALNVGILHIVDQYNIWLGYVTEVGNFTAGAGTHFNHGQISVAIHRQQGQWHANMIIEVARGSVDSSALA